jgi:hypothetical protein
MSKSELWILCLVAAFGVAALGCWRYSNKIASAYRRRRREQNIRRVLRGLARQYVSTVQWSTDSDPFSKRPDEPTPADPYIVVEDAVRRDAATMQAIHTCILRGWIEEIPGKIRSKLRPNDGQPLVDPPMWPFPMTHYRITEAGWAALNRAHAWTVAKILIGLLLSLLTLMGRLVIAAWSNNGL